MSNEQKINTNECIIQAVAEAARAAIQTMAMTGTATAENLQDPEWLTPITKQPTFDRSAKDKYAELMKLQTRGKKWSKTLI